MDTTDSPNAADAQRKIVNRLRRAHGQLAAVIAAVESDAHCRDVIHQLSAVRKALDRAGYLVISTALTECLSNQASANPDSADPADTHTSSTRPNTSAQLDQKELEKLFLSLA